VKNLSINIKLLILLSLILITVTVGLTIQSVNTIQKITNQNIQQYSKQVFDAKKESLKNYIDMAQGILQIYKNKVTKETTKNELEQIKKDAIKALDSMTYGKEGYIFVWNYSGVLLAFNPRADLIGKNLLNLNGGNEKNIVKNAIELVKKGGEHFYSYQWKIGKNDPYQNKISYIFGLQEWQWLIGTGEYTTKEEAQIAQKSVLVHANTNKLIKDIIIDAFIFISLIAITFYFILQKLINQPLHTLQNGLNEFFLFLQHKIDKVEPINVNSQDEFGKMITSINENIAVCTGLHREIIELNINLEEKINNRTIELKKQKESFAAIYNGSKDAIAILDMHSNFLDVNPAYIELTGMSKEEILSTSCLALTAEKDIEASKAAMQEVVEVGYIKNFEKECFISNGTSLIVNMSMSLLQDPKRILISLRDVTQKRKNAVELLLAKEKAEESSKYKSEFLANMSHEIRTPMNGILGMSHLVLQTHLDTKQKNYMQQIDNSAKALLRIVNDILDFSKIEAGKLKIENINFELHSVINIVTNLNQPDEQCR